MGQRKNRVFIFVALLVILLSSVCLAGCETTLFGSGIPTVFSNMPLLENERYLVIREAATGTNTFVVIDKQEGSARTVTLQYASNDRFATPEKVFYQGHHRTSLEGDTLVQYAFAWIPKYNVDTGAVESASYYLTRLTFDLYGNELTHEDDGEALSEEAMRAILTDAQKAELVEDGGFGIYVANGVYDDKDYGAEGKDADYEMSANELAVLSYVDRMEKTYRGDYHCTKGSGRVKGDKVYFSLCQSNQKDFMGQNATMGGIYRISVNEYDPESGEFRVLFESSKKESILAFDEHSAVLHAGDALYAYSFTTGERSRLLKLEGGTTYSYRTAGDYLLIDYWAEREEKQDGVTSRVDYRHLILMRSDGTVVFEGDDR